MLAELDRRVIPVAFIDLVRQIQACEAAHLAGGVALSGAYLAHRLSGDIDLFLHDPSAHRRTCDRIRELVIEREGLVEVVVDAGSFWRARITLEGNAVAFDVVHESVGDLEAPPPPLDGVVVESLLDLRAAKITCLLSRSEPRDLVDLYFLERAGYRVEDDLPQALRKDAGIDPATLAWLLRDFPVDPLPKMLLPLRVGELREYRDDLRERLRRLAVP